MEEIHGGEICSGGFQDAASSAFHRRVFHEDSYALDLREVANDVRVNPGDRRKFSRPVGFFVRPGEPCGRVRLPFGGHAVAELERGAALACADPFSGGAHSTNPSGRAPCCSARIKTRACMRFERAAAKQGAENVVILSFSSESEESLFDLNLKKEREILRFAQNDKLVEGFFPQHVGPFAPRTLHGTVEVAAEKVSTSHSEGLGLPEESAFSWVWRRTADPSVAAATEG